MPSVSKAQQRLMGADYARAKAGKPTVTGIAKHQLKDFASTKTSGLPNRVQKGSHGKAFA